MKHLILILLCTPLYSIAQYCIPTHGSKAVAPVISRITIGTIDNISGSGLTDYGYSDYTDTSTTLSVNQAQSLTVETGDFFPHNVGIWIDFDRNQIFTDDELIDKFVIGGNNSMSKTIEFELPENAVNGLTRLRVRGSLEPFGPWNLSMDPCMPASGDGETEDYTVEIENGIDGSIGVTRFTELNSKIDIEEEKIRVELINYGAVSVNNVEIYFTVDGELVYSEIIPENIEVGSSFIYSFPSPYDFSNFDCGNISVEIVTDVDEDQTDNSITKNICNLKPIKYAKTWYVHSNINGGSEPLGEEPFNSTTNVSTMDLVFGENNWNQDFFETADMTNIFSDSSCFVFLDGSYDHNLALETVLEENQNLIENWVASGGKLFINCAIELSKDFFIKLGFDETTLTFYQVKHAGILIGNEVNQGPYQPLSEELTGFYYANSVVVGQDLNIIAFEKNEVGSFNAPALHLPILAEKKWGKGMVIFGGLAPSQLVEPMTESMNLRANVVDYLSECDIVSSVQEITSSGELLHVYPNPASNVLYLENVGITNHNNLINIFNVSGQLVKEDNITESQQIDISGLAPGLYFLNVWTKEGNIKLKFTKM